MARNKSRNALAVLTVEEFVALLNSGGWQVTGGAYAKTAVEAVGKLGLRQAWVHPLGAIKIPVTAPHFCDTYSVPFADITITQPEPHVLHVNKIFPQKQLGKGGVEREVPLLGVWLKFVNLDIKQQQEEKKAQHEMEEKLVREKRLKDFLSRFPIGRILTDVEVDSSGQLMWFKFGEEESICVKGDRLVANYAVIESVADLYSDSREDV